jgi:hypothetical protein
MHDTDTNITLQQLRIYDGDELIFDVSDPQHLHGLRDRRAARSRIRRRRRREGRPMTFPRETIADGAAPRCDDCGRLPKLDVYLSGGGYYIGTCCCAFGPYTRESGYYRSRKLAQADLDTGGYGRAV